MLKIGDIEIGERPLLLAPMEDITDPSFRKICKGFGADMVYTEFVSSDGLIRNVTRCKKKLDITEDERPIGIQLYGHILDSMVEAAGLAESVNPDIIDLNFGCPVRKISNRGAGAGMLKDIPAMVAMTEAIVKKTSLPVTVKTRLGWDEDSKYIVDIAERLQDTGIKAITIHGRTRNQLYRGKADWELIGKVKNNPRMVIPVIGNGDVDGPLIAKKMFDDHGVDGIMIGRAAIGNPWIFREIKEFFDTGELPAPPTLAEVVELAKLQLDKSIHYKGSPRGIYEMRKQFIRYFKGLPDFKHYRKKLVTSTDRDEIFNTLDEILKAYREYIPARDPD